MSHRVLVLGAGYAGLLAAKRLARQVHPEEVAVTLVTEHPEFVERPRLHQLAVGQDIAATPVADYLDGTAAKVLIGRVTSLDLAARAVAVEGIPDPVGYDSLVYALGSNVDTGAVPSVAEHAFALTGRAAAARLTGRLQEARPGSRFVVCGGGLTGLEVAGEVAESYPSLDVHLVSVGTPGGWLSDRAQRYLRRAFDDLGVTVRTGRVTQVCADGLVLDGGARIPFDLCAWAGGFVVPPLARDAGLAVNDSGRAVVDETLRSVSHPNIYVVGDAAAVPGRWGDQLAMGCRTGGLMGPRVADSIAARLTGRAPKPFRYRYVHECLSLGRRRGVVQFLHADETPADRVLTGRLAIRYKNLTLDGARWLFRHPGPYTGGRRHVKAGDAETAAKLASA